MELFEIELFICIKVDLAWNNLQRLIFYKTQTNKLYHFRVGALSWFKWLRRSRLTSLPLGIEFNPPNEFCGIVLNFVNNNIN